MKTFFSTTTIICLLLLFISLGIVNAANAVPCDTGIAPYTAIDGFCAWVFASGLTVPRQLAYDSSNQLLVQENGGITALFDANNDGLISSDEKHVLVSGYDLSHSLVLEDWRYATKPGTLYRWAYTAGQRTNLGLGTPVIIGIPDESDFGPVRNAITFHNGKFYIVSPTNHDVLVSAGYGLVLECTADFSNVPSGGYTYSSVCTNYATGIRDPLTIAFDGAGRMWLPENGIDSLVRDDIQTGNSVPIAVTNPADSIYLTLQGSNHGFPYCWSEDVLPIHGLGRGTQWADPNFMNDGTHTDTWCRNPSTYHKADIFLPSHAVPLGLLFHTSQDASSLGLPASYQTNGLLVAQHGSFTGNGYHVSQFAFDNNWNVSSTTENVLLQITVNKTDGAPFPLAPHRPANLIFGKVANGVNTLFIADDNSGVILALSRKDGNPAPPNAGFVLSASYVIMFVVLGVLLLQ